MSLTVQEWIDDLVDTSERETFVIEKSIESLIEKTPSSGGGSVAMTDPMNDMIFWSYPVEKICPARRSTNFYGDSRYPVGIVVSGNDEYGKDIICSRLYKNFLNFPYFNMVLKLSGEYISDEAESIKDVKDRIDGLFSLFYPDLEISGIEKNSERVKNALFLVVDDFESCKYVNAAARYISLNVRELQTMKYPVFVIFNAESDEKVPGEISKLCRSIRIDAPDFQTRYDYLNSYFKRMALGNSISNQKLVQLSENTAGFSYKQLSDLVYLFSLENTWDDVFMNQAVKAQSSPKTNDDFKTDAIKKAAEFFSKPVSVNLSGNVQGIGVGVSTENNVRTADVSPSQQQSRAYSEAQIEASKNDYKEQLKQRPAASLMDEQLTIPFSEIEKEHQNTLN